MTPADIETAAGILADLRLGGPSSGAQLEDLPVRCRPQSLAEAYAIQDRLRESLAARGAGAPAGWKIGCTTPVMQAYLNIPHPCAGTLYQRSVWSGSATLDSAAYFQLGLECELAVRLGDTIPARAGGHDRHSVAACVESVLTSVEIVDHRFRDFTVASAASLVADDFFSCGCVLGADVPLSETGDPASLIGGFRIDGAPPAHTGRGEAILGHPLTALAWLADHLLGRGACLRRGEIVTLGSVVKTIYPSAGTRVQAVFEGLAPVVIDIA